MNERFSILADALSDDPRAAVMRAREIGFAGVAFNALALPELSQTGRREFRHLLVSNQQTLVALCVRILPHGLTRSADVDWIFGKLQAILQLSRDLQATCVAIDLGPLPAPDAAILELAQIVDRAGVHVALSSSLSKFAALEAIRKTADCPWFGIDLDPAAMVLEKWNPTHVLHVRARDALVGENHRAQPVEIGKGGVNWLELFATLDAASYRGWFTIDPTDLPDRIGAATRALKFLRALL